MKMRQQVSQARAMSVIGIALCLAAWVVTATAAMSTDSAFGDGGVTMSFSWPILVAINVLTCGGAVLLTRRATRAAQADALVDIGAFLARVSLIGVLGIALFMFAL